MYIVRYIVGNLVLWQRVRGAIKRDFQLYIRQYTSLNENLNMVIPILMHFCACIALNFLFILELECSKPHNSTKSDVFNDIKLFPTVRNF